MPWLGKRIVSLCATVPWHLQSSGRRARKAKFAHQARTMRRWRAQHKREQLASGRCFLATPAQVQAFLQS